MAKRSKRSRDTYRPARPISEVQPNRLSGGPASRSPGGRRRPARRGSGFPLLPVSLAGLGIGLLVIAGLVLANQPPAETELAAPEISYPAQNPDRSLGSPDAAVTVEEWADFQCRVCGRFAQTLEPRLIDTYVRTDKVRFVFRDLAFIGGRIQSESVQAAAAARCAADEDRFWPYQGYLFANQAGENLGAFSDDRLRQIAAAVGLDTTAFDACLTSGTKQAEVRAETTAGFQRGISSTPTLVIGNQAPRAGLLTWEQLSTMIEAELAAAGS